MYDYLIVGAGLYGATFAYEATCLGKKCLVIDKRDHIGGNAYTEKVEGINVHRYGAHIFHTDDKEVWNFVNRFAEFNGYRHQPIAIYEDEVFNLPFNMNTFNQMWGVTAPEDAEAVIDDQRNGILAPQNLEEQAIALVGTDIYLSLIKEYTEKQWGRPCDELPPDIIKRLPLRFMFDNSYFNDRYQGIPIGGYTPMIERMLEGIEVRLNTEYNNDKTVADTIVYTGSIDEYYNRCYGTLEYRSLAFEDEVHNRANCQGNAVVNYTASSAPYTRIIEHKHFEYGTQDKTVITMEYPEEYKRGQNEPYYPIHDKRNTELYERYRALAKKETNVIFGGRLGTYRYLDMWQVIREALDAARG